MKIRRLLIPFSAAMLFSAYFPLAAYLSIAPFGIADLYTLSPFLFFIFMGVYFLAALYGASVVATRDRYNKRMPLGRCMLLFAGAAIVLTVVGMRMQMPIRMAGFNALGERLEPLISAIKQFDEDNGEPPKILKELAPDYIDQIPGTGMKAYGKLVYKEGDGVFYGCSWMLSVPTRPTSLHYEAFVYLSDEDYSQAEGGERLGKWAFFHK